MANEILRHKLNKLPFYKNNKEELVKLAKQLNVDSSGSKVEVAQRIAKAQKLTLDDSPLYTGRLRTIPILSSNVRKLGKPYVFYLFN